MSVLDELLDAIKAQTMTERPSEVVIVDWSDVEAAFIDFERARPGLIDLTVICKRCGAMPEGELAGWDELRRLADEDRRAWTCPECGHV